MSYKSAERIWKEELAIAHLRTWALDRIRLENGHTWTNPGRPSQYSRRRAGDARLVRCIDFERALESIPVVMVAMLVLRYRDGLSAGEIAEALGCSPKTVLTYTAVAKSRLTDALERRRIL